LNVEPAPWPRSSVDDDPLLEQLGEINARLDPVPVQLLATLIAMFDGDRQDRPGGA
jgi:hypothetical protein